jgi:deoxyadenosine/deoxycytidine kinase
VPTLQRRIARRNREYERSISVEYLERINQLYEAWISAFTLCPVLTVPADNLDFVAHPGHMRLVVEKVQEKLTGKEVVSFEPNEVFQLSFEE